jgi:type IV pilus assembly protein PilC
MAKFKVRFINSTGEIQEDNIDATDKAALYNDVKQRNETLISAEEHQPASKKRKVFSLDFIFGRVKTHDRIIFIRNLGSMIEAGLPLSRALAVIEKQTQHKKFKSIISELGKNIGQGHTLSDGLREHSEIFSPLVISMVKAGEESGSLAQSLRMISVQMESAYVLTRKIRGAMTYPAIILFTMVLIGFFMLTFVVPTLSATFKELNAELPLSTRIIIFTSDFLQAHILVSLGAILLVGVALFYFFKTKIGKRFTDYSLLHIPIIKTITKEINSARTARTLSSLLSAGVDIVVSTQITGEVIQNSYFKEVLKAVEQKIQKGEPIASIFGQHEHLYPPFVGEMISVGEETGQLGQMLLGVATFYESEVDQKTKDMSTIIEPFLMVFIGIVVGLFAISMISPIYSIGNSI